MKVLTISRNKLELATAPLRRPILTIGRSPSCDLLLRAPDVEPIHFLVEWIGSGQFDPKRGAWSIVNISRGANSGESGDSGEGVVLSDEPVETGGFQFACVEDSLESHEVIGGRIFESLGENRESESEMLELVQVRVDSGAVEQVIHVPSQKRKRLERILPDTREFKIEWQGEQGAALKVLLEEMPGAEVFNRGQRVERPSICVLKPTHILQIRWKGRDFYLRFVHQIHAASPKRDPFGDPLLKRLTLSGLLLGALLFALSRSLPQDQPPAPLPPRIVRIELPPEEKPAPPAIPSEVEQTAVFEKVETEKPATAPKKDELKLTTPEPKSPGKATTTRAETKPAPVSKTGLNSPAKITDVNAVGILGALNKVSTKGKGVSADKIINEGIVTESVSRQEKAKFVMRTPPAGVLGSGRGGDPKGSNTSGLSAASTTLKGAGNYDPSAVGPVAAKGGGSGYSIGSGTVGAGSNVGGGKALGNLDGGDFNVEGGGLDRETVRRVIVSYRGQIRTCYERALLVSRKLEGRVVYRWTIATAGSVASVEITRSTVESPNLRSCVSDVIKKMSFPKSTNGKHTVVIYPFVFQSKK